MAKKSTTSAASDRQAKIQAAQKSQGSGANRIVVATVVVVVAIIAVVGGVVWSQSQKEAATGTSTAVPAGASMGKGYPAFANVTAAAGAPTVDLYEDFQCPNCKAFEDTTGQTLAQLVAAGTVQARYHGMAFLDTSANDEYSTRALNAAAVVLSTAGPDAFQTFHDLLYANQPAEGGSGLTDEQLIEYAGQTGATGSTVQAQIHDLTYGDWVTKATDQASKDGVTGTPTVFVDGTELSDLSAAGLTAAVSAAQAG
jgi:protein-disulfide isomerase